MNLNDTISIAKKFNYPPISQDVINKFYEKLGLKFSDDFLSIASHTSFDCFQMYEFDNFDWLEFSDLSFPVIIKPIDEAHGNGVCMNIISILELQKKLKISFSLYPKMIIQEQISGDECRVLVVL